MIVQFYVYFWQNGMYQKNITKKAKLISIHIILLVYRVQIKRQRNDERLRKKGPNNQKRFKIAYMYIFNCAPLLHRVM